MFPQQIFSSLAFHLLDLIGVGFCCTLLLNWFPPPPFSSVPLDIIYMSILRFYKENAPEVQSMKFCLHGISNPGPSVLSQPSKQQALQTLLARTMETGNKETLTWCNCFKSRCYVYQNSRNIQRHPCAEHGNTDFFKKKV